MSRTDVDPSTLARSLRCMAGDGSMEWVMEPIQASVLLDVADLLDENAKLLEMLAEDNEELAKMRRVIDHLYSFAKTCGVDTEDMRELEVEVS